jgi:uncharacterized protein (TIGR00299 family) protein
MTKWSNAPDRAGAPESAHEDARGNAAHFDPISGASGDMILGALVDAGAPLDEIRRLLATLPVPAFRIEAREARVHGFRALRLHVETPHEHVHRHLSDIETMIAASALPAWTKDAAIRVFRRLAQAEAHVHGIDVERVHFHEVGALDSILDVVGSVLALELLGVTTVTFSELHDGTGTVATAHGEVPVPVPAVLELTRGLPIVRVEVRAELLTPTGAAILTTLGTFERAPGMRVDRIGVACGARDNKERPNLLRVAVGTSVAPEIAGKEAATGREAAARNGVFWDEDEVVVLEANLDDMTPEVLAHVIDRAMAQGALDAFVIPCAMKKGRPGHLVTLLVRPADEVGATELLLGETSTFGVRRRRERRAVLRREISSIETEWGPVQVKIGHLGDGKARVTPEFESCRKIADERGLPLQEVLESVQQLIRSSTFDESV